MIYLYRNITYVSCVCVCVLYMLDLRVYELVCVRGRGLVAMRYAHTCFSAADRLQGCLTHIAASTISQVTTEMKYHQRQAEWNTSVSAKHLSSSIG